MRIERVLLQNYRQFRKLDISFKMRSDIDLHYLVGTNGTGKTNILNAINFCLYGEEPHLSKDSEHLPLLNLKTVQEMEVGKKTEVIAEVRTETEDNDYVNFKRRSMFVKNSDGSLSKEGTVFEVRFIDEDKNVQIATDEAAIMWVERFVPTGIREFFFFDGERLDNYFRQAVGQNIRHAIFQISQIDLLENNIEKRLQIFLDDLRKEAGQANPKIEEVRAKLENAIAVNTDFNNRYSECETQINVAKENITELDAKLKGIPDLQNIEIERQELILKQQETKQILDMKENEKKDIIYNKLIIMMLWPTIKSAFSIIEEKKASNEIPPQVDKSLLDEILKANSCSICGRPLDEKSKVNVNNLIDKVKTSSIVAKHLLQMENPLNHFKVEVNRYKGQINNINQEISRYEKDMSAFALRRDQINQQMSGYDEKLISVWYKDRTKYEDLRDQNNQTLGELGLNKSSSLEEINKYERELDIELQKEGKVRELHKKITFCENAISIVKTIREKIMKQTREKIEIETKRQFFNLVWKKDTFGDIKILEDYSIKLIHMMGYDCLGSISAGEREMLALSFTLALHQTSGFDSPIIIDTPVARISDLSRKNFANVIYEVGTYKQVVLLFTPDEYSDNIRECISGRASGRYKLKLNSNEKEVSVEVL